MENIYESTGGLGAVQTDDLGLPMPTSGPPGGRPPAPLALPTTTATSMLNPVQQSMYQAASAAAATPAAPPTSTWMPPPVTGPLPSPSAPMDTRWTPSQPVGSEWWHWVMYAGVGAACGWAMAPSEADRIKWLAIGAVAGGVGQGIGLGVAGFFALREKDGDLSHETRHPKRVVFRILRGAFHGGPLTMSKLVGYVTIDPPYDLTRSVGMGALEINPSVLFPTRPKGEYPVEKEGLPQWVWIAGSAVLVVMLITTTIALQPWLDSKGTK